MNEAARCDANELSIPADNTICPALPYAGKKDLSMTIEFPKQAREDAVNSIKKYFEENMPEPVGDLAAGLLLDFFVEEIGPLIYNRAIADAQARMERHISDVSGELYADEFQYWPRLEAKRRKHRL